MATGWLWEERYAWHDSGTWADYAQTPRNAYVQPEPSFEEPETKRRFRNLLDVTGVLEHLVTLRARAASDEEILRVHPAAPPRSRAPRPRGGGWRRRARPRDRRRGRQRLRARAPARPPCGAGARHG